jgi:hypothetical protein
MPPIYIVATYMPPTYLVTTYIPPTYVVASSFNHLLTKHL